MKRMRINYASYGLPLTGGARTLLTLASHLAERGHDVSFTILERRVKVDLPMSKKVKIIGGEIPWAMKLMDPLFYAYSRGMWKTDYIRFGWMLEMLKMNVPFDFDKLLYNEIPDSDISAATHATSAFPVNMAAGPVKVHHLQHFDAVFATNPYEKARLLEAMKLPLLKVANSTWLQKKLKSDLNQESVFVPWGIDTETFNTKPTYGEGLKNIFTREDGELYVVSLGRSTRWKGLPELFEALKYIKKKRPELNIKLILYGKEPKIKDQSPVPCIYLQGPSDEELKFLYQNSDAVVTPSHYESFPLPPIEGMACGAKVVTTPYGVEDYAVNDYNSIIVKPQDLKSLANGLIKALTDKELGTELKQNGPRTAKQFTWERSVDKIEKIYYDALKESHR